MKSNVLRTDHAQIRDKSRLPISKLSYGPHQVETEQMTITVSKLVCQQDDLETYETLEDQISETNAMITDLKETVEEDDIEIRNLVKNQQETFENHINEFGDLQEKVEDQDEKQIESKAAIEELSEKANSYEQKHTKIEQLINQQSDLHVAHKDKFDDHIIQFNSLQGTVENHGQKHTESKAAFDELSEKTNSFETQFDSLKDQVEDHAEEYAKLNDTIMEHTEMKMQEHMDNGHPYQGT